MAASPQDVQAKLKAAQTALSKTTSTYPAMVKKYGSDWHKWPSGTQWYIAESNIEVASIEVGSLVAPSPPKAEFSFKEV